MQLEGKLIVFEGIDFTGKSTQTRQLAKRLREEGYRVTTTREPGGTPLGEKVRRLILSNEHQELLPLSELLLFIMCRAQLYAGVIRPALDRGEVVVSSRYRLSSLAYQGYGRAVNLDLVRRLNHEATQGREPDITFLLDLPAERAVRRKRGRLDRIESEAVEFYTRVRQGYLDLTEGQPDVHRLDGTQSVDAIASEVAACLGV